MRSVRVVDEDYSTAGTFGHRCHSLQHRSYLIGTVHIHIAFQVGLDGGQHDELCFGLLDCLLQSLIIER